MHDYLSLGQQPQSLAVWRQVRQLETWTLTRVCVLSITCISPLKHSVSNSLVGKILFCNLAVASFHQNYCIVCLKYIIILTDSRIFNKNQRRGKKIYWIKKWIRCLRNKAAQTEKSPTFIRACSRMSHRYNLTVGILYLYSFDMLRFALTWHLLTEYR